MKRDNVEPDALPSKSSAGEIIGGILAGLDHALPAGVPRRRIGPARI